MRSTRQACFFSRLNPQESSLRQRTIDWKGPDDETRMVLCKHRHRPEHDCFFLLQSATCSKRTFFCSIKVAVTLFSCTTICWQAHWTRLPPLQTKFCLKGISRLQSRGRRLSANELTFAYQVNQMYQIQKTRKRKHIPYFQFDKNKS